MCALQCIPAYFKRNDLCLLQADKEGSFVVMPEDTFSEKARKGIDKNFAPIKISLPKTKKALLRLCEENELQQFTKSIDKSVCGSLTVFFSATTHKQHVPLRAIVSERGTWQLQVSKFLLKSLKQLHIHDPFLAVNSDDISKIFQLNQNIGYVFSVDIEDLFYSMPHNALFTAVWKCIEVNGDVSFQSSVGYVCGQLFSFT